VQQLCVTYGYEVVYIGNAARSYIKGRYPGSFVFKSFVYFMRYLFELFLAGIYYGERLPLDPNITFIIRNN